MKYFKRFIFFLLVINFLEVLFSIFIFEFKIENYLNMFLYSIIISSFLSIITGIFKDKVNTVITSIILFIIACLFSLQLVFYNTFKTFFSFSILGLSDQLNSFMGETVRAIIDNFVYILVFLLPFIIYLIFKKKIKLERNNKTSYLIYIGIMFLGIALFMTNMMISKDKENSVYYLYHDVNSISLNLEKLGVNNSYLIDVYRAIFDFDEEIVPIVIEESIDKKDDIAANTKEEVIEYGKNIIDSISFDKSTNNSDIKKINEYMKSLSGTSKNEYTGKFKDYNLIYIVAESFSEIGISEELTPTLYKLTHTGFVFDNFYTPNTLSTIGGEFQALTGLYPDSSILSKWRKGTNYFPYGLSTIYKGLGYKTYAYHNNWYGFQDRHKYLKSQGFTNYIGCYNGMEKRINCKRWPQSDLEMMQKTMDDYVNNEDKFLAYYMTVSGHFSYNFSDNSMANKNKKYVNNLNVPTSAKAYVATQIELDRAMEYLLNKLEEVGKLDNTVIVLMADHYPYNLDSKAVNSLSTYKRDSVVEVNHNALIIWNSRLETEHISKTCMSSDVLPTVYNLFGIDYDSRLFTGNDIFSDTSGLAIFNNRSWVSDKGTYFTSGSKFVAKENVEIDDKYVANINSMIKNRLSVAKMIVKNDYYKYLLK